MSRQTRLYEQHLTHPGPLQVRPLGRRSQGLASYGTCLPRLDVKLVVAGKPLAGRRVTVGSDVDVACGVAERPYPGAEVRYLYGA